MNEVQLKKVAEFLDCHYESLFVADGSAQPEVVKAWQDEQKARRQKNVGGGLRVLGAGLRYIRGQKKMSLMSIAKGAKLTLSVYHRIEMGQREVDEKTFENIAFSCTGFSGTSQEAAVRNGAVKSIEHTNASSGR